jgi:Transcriptional regulator PadR-like family
VHGTSRGPGRFAGPWLLVLTSLAGGPRHGYAIMADVAAFSDVRMEPGTLYRALSWLGRRGRARQLATGDPRRRYEITAVWPSPGSPASGGGSRAPHRAGRGRPPRLTGSAICITA